MAFETDYAGVVSNTRFLEYIERGRYHLTRAAGIVISDVWELHGVQPLVRRVTMDYRQPAMHEDDLELTTRVVEHSRATTVVGHRLVRPADGALIMEAEQTIAYINRRWKAVRVPEVFRRVLPVEDCPGGCGNS